MAQMLTALLFSVAGISSLAIIAAMLRANGDAVIRALAGEGAFVADAAVRDAPRPVHVVSRTVTKPVSRLIAVPRFRDMPLRVAA
ncbi:MAG: hypothetical protein RLZZ58_37 [Pseudomonadota bacterium]